MTVRSAPGDGGACPSRCDRPLTVPDHRHSGRDPEYGVRPPAVAGRFYPAEPAELAAMVDRMLDAAGAIGASTGEPGAAYVVPHAALRYSGPTAAHAYAQVRACRTHRGTVVL